MKERLAKLYKSVILKHNQAPFHYEKKEEANIVLEAYNPLCGDQFRLYLKVEKERIVEAHFYGYGCAISKASTSVLVQRIEGKTLEDLSDLLQRFTQVLAQEQALPDEELEAFAGVRDFPGRMQCATLSWERLEHWLETAT